MLREFVSSAILGNVAMLTQEQDAPYRASLVASRMSDWGSPATS